jgi:hypothetical protein
MASDSAMSKRLGGVVPVLFDEDSYMGLGPLCSITGEKGRCTREIETIKSR